MNQPPAFLPSIICPALLPSSAEPGCIHCLTIRGVASRKSIEQEEEQQRKGEKEKERKKDLQGKSIFLNIVLRFQSKQSPEDHAGKRDAPLPLSLPFLCSNEKIGSFARSFGCLVASLMCIFSACEKGHFPERQGGALGKCGL